MHTKVLGYQKLNMSMVVVK